MFHNDDTLNLLEKYRKTKFNEKENGQFRTNNRKENRASIFLWIVVVVFVGYFIITNFVAKIEKHNEIKKETVNTNKMIDKNIEVIQNKPIAAELKNTPKLEQAKQTTTITLTPQQSSQKQEPIKKMEEEEIHPSTTTMSVGGYYR